METPKISIEQARVSLDVVYSHIDAALLHIPHDLMIPLLDQFRLVLSEYDLIKLQSERFFQGPPRFIFKDTCLRNLQEVLRTAHERIEGTATLKPAIDELDFLITAEILIRTDNF